MKFYGEQIKQLLMASFKLNRYHRVRGLIPDGDVSIQWRWLGPVYEDSTQDTLNNSIVVRNLQELGVDSIEALKYLFPSKTDEERAAMLSGFPFRMVNELQGAYSQFAKLVGGNDADSSSTITRLTYGSRSTPRSDTISVSNT